MIKQIRMHRILKAKLNDFMLEKSRVALEFPHERNFLIFYYLLAGLDKNILESLKLKDIQKHKYLKFRIKIITMIIT